MPNIIIKTFCNILKVSFNNRTKHSKLDYQRSIGLDYITSHHHSMIGICCHHLAPKSRELVRAVLPPCVLMPLVCGHYSATKALQLVLRVLSVHLYACCVVTQTDKTHTTVKQEQSRGTSTLIHRRCIEYSRNHDIPTCINVHSITHSLHTHIITNTLIYTHKHIASRKMKHHMGHQQHQQQ